MQNIKLPRSQRALDPESSIEEDGDFSSLLVVNVEMQLHRASTLLARLDGTLSLVGNQTPEEVLLTAKIVDGINPGFEE